MRRSAAEPVWTCAPYQLPGGPQRGDHIVAGESNAVTFYNSVIGARTNKYGDYLDVACALIGKAPLAGLHTDEGRKAALLFRTADIRRRLEARGHLLSSARPSCRHASPGAAFRRSKACRQMPAEDDLQAP